MSDPVKFTGHASAMKKDSEWLAAEDINGYGDIEVTIEEVFKYDEAKFKTGRTEKNLFSLKFVGKEKQLKINSYNRKMLVAKFGVKTQEWRGKKVVIYFDPEVKFAGRTVGGIRIK